MPLIQKLTGVFAGAAMLSLAHAAVAADQPAKPRLFLPEVCETQSAPAAVTDIAFNDSLFTAVEDWRDRPDAPEILTQRLCREGLPDGLTTTVLSDALTRLYDKEWLKPVLVSFMEADPVKYWTIIASPFDTLARPLHAEGAVKIKGDVLKTIVSDVRDNEETYKQVINNYAQYKDTPEARDVLQIIFDTMPGLYWELQADSRIQDVITDLSLRPSAQALLDLARGGKTSAVILYNYDRYADLPEAAEIARLAVESDPMAFLDLQAAHHLPLALETDQDLQVNAQTLMDIAKNPEKAETLILRYSAYQAIDGAKEIAKKAIGANPVVYFELKSKESLPDALDTQEFLPDADTLIQGIRRNGRAFDSVARIYPLIADISRISEIAQAAVDSDPLVFFLQKNWEELPAAFNGVTPSANAMWTMLRSGDQGTAAINVINYYADYASLPEAKEILQHAADLNPLTYMGNTSPEQRAETGIFPHQDKFFQILSDKDAAGILLFQYPIFKDLPYIKEAAQAAINKNPPYFWDADNAERLGVDLNIAGPTDAAIEAWLKEERDISTLLNNYGHYRDVPGVRDLLKAAIRDRPLEYLYHKKTIASEDVKDPFFMPDDADVMREIKQGGKDKSQAAIDLYGLSGGLSDAALKIALDRVGDFEIPFRDSGVSFPSSLLPDTGGRTLTYRQGLVLYQLVRNPRRSEDILYKNLKSVLELAWHEKARDLLLSQAAGNSDEFLDQLSGITAYNNMNALDSSLRGDLLSTAFNHIDRTCKDARDGILNSPWLLGEPAVTPQVLQTLLDCAFSRSFNSAIDFIANGFWEGQLRQPAYTDVVRETVRRHPIELLYELQDADGLDRDGLNISYADLAKWASASLANEKTFENSDLLDNVLAVLNALHEEQDEIRFAMLDGLKPSHYLMLIDGDPSLYFTSTFNRIYEGVRLGLRDDADARASLFADTDKAGDRLANLIYLASSFGKMDDFLGFLNETETRRAFDVTIKAVKDRSGGSDTSYGYYTVAANAIMCHARKRFPEMKGLEAELVRAISGMKERTAVAQTIGVIASLYARGNEPLAYAAFFAQARTMYDAPLDRYQKKELGASGLFDAKGDNYQRIVFYNDKDGEASYYNFRDYFRRDPSWAYADKGRFIIFSRKGVHMLANKPADRVQGQQDITAYVAAQGEDAHISILTHRGHSYHVAETLRDFLDEHIQFLWLGSCRTQEVWNYLSSAPNMQFIYSQNVGTKNVNDPMLKYISDRLARRQDVNWQALRQSALNTGDARAKDYVFPDGSPEYAVRMSLASTLRDPAVGPWAKAFAGSAQVAALPPSQAVRAISYTIPAYGRF